MTRTRKVLLGTVAAVGMGWAAMAVTGVGSQTLNTAKLELISEAAAAPGSFRGHGRGHGGMHRMCGPQRAERLDNAIGFVEAFFSFNDTQKAAWDGLVTAVRDGSDTIGKNCEAMRSEGRETTATGRLAQMETGLSAGLEIVQKVRPAFERFYGTLDEKQQAALDKLIQHRGPMGRGARPGTEDGSRR